MMRAHVRPRFEFGGVDVVLVDARPGDYARVRQWSGGGVDYRLIPPDDSSEAPLTDRLMLPDEEARALYEALAEHYGHGTNDVRALRRDYDAERARVDKLIDVVVELGGAPVPAPDIRMGG